MMDLFFRIKNYLLPFVMPEVQEDIDRESMRNISHVSLFVLFFETLTAIVYSATRSTFDQQYMLGVLSVAFAILSCALGYLVAHRMLGQSQISHRAVTVFKLLFFVGFSIWGAMADYRQYVLGNQISTFFTVEMLMVCFVLLRPLAGAGLISAAFLGLYLALWSNDGAARIVVPNYCMLALVSIFGMMVRYHTQLYLSSKTTWLAYNNKILESVGRHDALTGLRNRKALHEDAARMIGAHICIFMVDVNYFKEINDSYGHIIGDSVLQAVSLSLRQLYPDSRRYRFGGDEFLIVSEQPREELYENDTYRFHWTSEELSLDVDLSIGFAEGTPETHEELLELVSKADSGLYEVKKRTHSPANGGHERRGKKREKKTYTF